MEQTIGNLFLPRVSRRILRPDFISVAFDLLTVWDLLTVALGGYACALLYASIIPAEQLPTDFLITTGRISIVGGLLAPLVLRRKRMISASDVGPIGELVGRVALGVILLMSLLLTIGFLTRTFDAVPRIWVLLWSTSAFVLAVTGRLLLVHRVRALEAAGSLRERVAIVGSGPLADQLIAHLHATCSRRVEIVGLFDDWMEDGSADPDTSGARAPQIHAPQANGPQTHSLLGGIADLVELGKRDALDRVILALPATSEERLFNIALQIKSLDVELSVCPPLIGLGLAGARIGFLGDVPMIVLAHRPIRSWGLVLKAIEDRVLGGLLLVALFPLLVAIGIAVRLDSPGPALFRQRRHGWNNTEFQVVKFRTMTWGASAAGGGLVQTRRNDQRVTRVGGFLRRTSLDELPQLLNVLRGEMSLVGPRPHAVVMRTEERLGHEIIAEYTHRHRVKPGITGWAQVNGHRGATETAQQIRKRVEYDIYYIDNWSIFFDLKILLMTPLKMIFDRSNAF
jgi:Undecaprenyl-phosphate glucose phosphotransferase